MFLKILFTATTMFFSCSPVAKEKSVANQKMSATQKITLLSATETDWFGGVKGVRGKIYTVRIKSSLKQKVTFSALEINGEKIPVEVLIKNNIYTVSARTSVSNPQPDVGAAPGSENLLPAKNGILHYTEYNSKTVRNFSVPKFTHVENVMENGEKPVQ